MVFSGGQDSTTCLHWALNAFASVEGVFFDYGQRHQTEMLAAQTLAWRLRIPLRIFRLDFFRELKGNALTDASMAIEGGTTGTTGGEGAPASVASGLPNTFVPGRNLLFLTQAAAYAYTRGIRDVVTGVCQTDYSGYPDCRLDTIRALQRSLHLGLGWPERNGKGGGTFRIHTPLMFRTKAESVALARRWGALESLAYTHTCYEGAFPPCGKCPACVLRARGFAEAGIPDPLVERAAAAPEASLSFPHSTPPSAPPFV
ncbi:MAG: aluminum resistance protein [Fibrobacteria bacterium]|nr:aluminum resistance protein [Fibrobacteria bacterium]